MVADSSSNAALRAVERLGRGSLRLLEAVGYGGLLLWDSMVWVLLGRRRRQPVRPASVLAEMMEIGIRALPIVTLLSGTIGIMLSLQGIDALKQFGAESQVVVGVVLGITREFAPLITGILVAGRSGAALAARLGTMIIRQEVDALEVMGINPIRYLVVPSLIGMLVMLPALTLWADFVGLAGAGLYITSELGMSVSTYIDQTLQYPIGIDDVLHGVEKSVIFAALITIVGVRNGASLAGGSEGAEGVGRVTTNAVVHGIIAILLTDMVFIYVVTR